MKNRILIAILLPVVLAGIILTFFTSTCLVPPLLAFIQHRTETSLVLMTDLGLEKCASRHNYLLDSHLEENPHTVKTVKRDTLAEIEALGRRFDDIRLLVLDNRGEILGAQDHDGVAPFGVLDDLNTSGRIFNQQVFGRPAAWRAFSPNGAGTWSAISSRRPMPNP